MMNVLFVVCALVSFARYNSAMGYGSFYDGSPTLRFLERGNRMLNDDGDSNFGRTETPPGVQDSRGSMTQDFRGNVAPALPQQNSSAIMPGILNAQFGQNVAQMPQNAVQMQQVPVQQNMPIQNIPGYSVPQVNQEGSAPQLVQNTPLEHSPALQTAIAAEQMERADANLRGTTNGQRDPLFESLQEVEKQLSNALGAVKERLESIQELNKRPIHVDCGVTRVRFVCPKKNEEEEDDGEDDDNDEAEEDEE